MNLIRVTLTMGGDLLVDWCSYQAAEYAVKNWHYSECMPAIKNVRLGVWEHDEFIGTVLFSRSANANLGKAFDVDQDEYAELTRIALTEHETPVSRIGSIAIKMLSRKDPGLKLLFSYADPLQDHDGTIYQAMNWIYVGRGSPSRVGRIEENGDWMHSRQINRLIGTGQVDRSEVVYKRVPGKHKYIYPLDTNYTDRVEGLRHPHP